MSELQNSTPTQVLLPLALIVLLTTVATEVAARKDWLPYWVARKLLHVIAVGACAFATLLIERELLTYIVAGAEVVLLGLILSNQLMREETGRRAWGIVWFPLAYLLLLVSVRDDQTVCIAMLILALCDPLATVVGKLKPWKPYELTGDRKTWSGSLAFAAGCTVLLMMGFENAFWIHIPVYAALLTAAEALGSKGRDNLYVPLLAAFLLVHGQEMSFLPEKLFFGAFLFLLFTLARKSLTLDGALAAIILGYVVSLKAGLEWLLPLFIFFLSSSLIGKLFPAHTLAGDAKQKQARDGVQVLANGAVYAFVVVNLSPKTGLFGSFNSFTDASLLAIMAIATADTWSSEVGQYFRQPTYDLLRWKKVPPGLSGGVSLAGTLAGFAGALFLAATCSWLLDYNFLECLIVLTSTGFVGMLLDSVLGSAFQATYVDAEGKLYDTPAEDRTLKSGYAWMTNDLVNLLATLVGLFAFQFFVGI